MRQHKEHGAGGQAQEHYPNQTGKGSRSTGRGEDRCQRNVPGDEDSARRQQRQPNIARERRGSKPVCDTDKTPPGVHRLVNLPILGYGVAIGLPRVFG